MNTQILLGGDIDMNRNEENPMLGFRGASRYLDPQCSSLALRWNAMQLSKVRETMGLNNVQVMIPICENN